MQRLLSAVATMTDKVTELSHKITELEEQVSEMKEIVQAWEAMKTGGKFVKWLAGIGSGIAGLWILAKAIGANLFK